MKKNKYTKPNEEKQIVFPMDAIHPGCFKKEIRK
jgi:hypothetical protein